MREVLLTTLLALSLLPAALAGPDGRATATVVSIGDGDTIRVIEGGKRITVRLACIDAPELAQAPYGEQARNYLQSRLKIGSKVHLLSQTVDRYGRTVAEVIGEVNLNLAMVEDGMAFAYLKYLGQCDEKAYLDAEFRASRRRYGVWQVPGGITRPWDFDAAEDHRDLLLIPDPFLLAAAIAAVRSAPMPAPRNCCALEMTVGRTIGTGIFFHFAMLVPFLLYIDGPHRI